jgi:two-component system phosphate regulon sensor histidine kinase PhoR
MTYTTEKIPLDLRLKSVLQRISDSVIIVDEKYKIIDINKTAVKTLKIKELNLHKSFIDNILDNELKMLFVKLFQYDEKKTCFNLKLKVEDVYLQFFAYPLRNNEKRIGTLVVIKERPLDLKFRQMRENFVANVSHELKTPLTIINGVAENLLDGTSHDSAEIEHFMRVIKKHAGRLNTLINDILSLSSIDQKLKQEDITVSRCSVCDIIRNVATMFEEKVNEKNIDLSIDCRGDIYINANKILIEQALSNLIDNAIKYNSPGGMVSVKVEQEKKKVLISVEDNGIGIRQKDILRIFERFYRVDKQKSRNLGGTGLGLSIVKKTIKLHKGFISVKSKHGKGSIFAIILPRASRPRTSLP